LPTILPADAEGRARAVELLRAGRLVAFPTETVYGLGADATNETAVAGIFAAKGRPRFNPLIAHCASLEEAQEHAHFPPAAARLAAAVWPGPLTLVLPRRASSPIALLCSAGLDTVALRVPAGPCAHGLIRGLGRPIAAPSANRSGRVSPTTAGHVAEELGEAVALILDGGPCTVGLESTVVSLAGDEPLLLRPGGLPPAAIERWLGRPLRRPEADAPLASPGMLASHYAPERPIRLNAAEVRPDEALLAFGPRVPPGAAFTLNLSDSGDLTEAAAHLFAALRAADRAPVSAIAVMAIPEEGLGLAINDRLRRAAAPRG